MPKRADVTRIPRDDRIPVKDLKSLGPRTQPWGTPEGRLLCRRWFPTSVLCTGDNILLNNFCFCLVCHSCSARTIKNGTKSRWHRTEARAICESSLGAQIWDGDRTEKVVGFDARRDSAANRPWNNSFHYRKYKSWSERLGAGSVCRGEISVFIGLRL